MTEPGDGPSRAIAASYALATVKGLAELLEAPVCHTLQAGTITANDLFIGWGKKASAVKARALAQHYSRPCWLLEDGFLRSVGVGSEDPPLSLVVDPVGIYYDANAPSLLESQILAPLTSARLERSTRLIAAWRDAGVSKYNHARDYGGELPERYVLVIDQTAGDASIAFGQADQASFQRMLQAALVEHPDCTILLKVHPEVLRGRKRGHFDQQDLPRNGRITVLGEDVHPVRLISRAEAIYTVTSQVGFEGLLWGKPVRTFGMPFYAGWGLTDDDLTPPPRRRPVALPALVHAALVDYPRYLNPETGERCEVEIVLAHLAWQRQQRERFPVELHAVGFSLWKRRFVRNFLAGSRITFHRTGRTVPPASVAVVWGSRPGSELPAETTAIIRVEDGFLRSVGLGVDLVQPLSWVMDRRGIYYDSSAPSDLEILLQTADFTPALLSRAELLRQRIVRAGLTKYNVGDGTWQRPPTAQRVILVPGQVENDASIRFGAAGMTTNLALLQRVRREHPEAYLLYKPHPDVVSGLRKNRDEPPPHPWCDEVILDLPMGRLIDVVDEVHVLTSLAGFEALLRQKPVTTYGQPFYAGWGLTSDAAPISRRTRQLSLNELVAGALILYPVYLSRATNRYTTPEQALDELLAWRNSAEESTPLWRSLWRIFLRSGLVRR